MTRVGKEAEFWTGSTWARPSWILVITKMQDGRAHVLPVQNSASFPTDKAWFVGLTQVPH